MQRRGCKSNMGFVAVHKAISPDFPRKKDGSSSYIKKVQSIEFRLLGRVTADGVGREQGPVDQYARALTEKYARCH